MCYNGRHMADKDEIEGEAIIPEEDFREAIAACCEDPLLERYFKLAPRGAKLFIGLGFYSTHFGDKVDPRQYAECQAEIEPALTANDLKYLIRFEEDKATKRYLRGLLERVEDAADGGGESVEENAQQPTSDVQRSTEEVAIAQSSTLNEEIPIPRRRRVRRASSSGLQWIMRRDTVRWVPFVCKTAALLAILIGGVVFVVMNWHRMMGLAEHKDEVAVEPVSDIVPIDNATHVVESAPPAVAEVPEPPPVVSEAPAAVQQEETLQPASNVVAAVKGDKGEADVAQDAGGNGPVDGVQQEDVRKSARRPKVVFTDGRKIVRHSGGRIEVPRVFSCAGAGIKPFWVYGPNPDAEAEKERKARREGQSLVEQAKKL